ncbi:MAG: hypothetical protein ACRCZZ_08210 [Phocaeicola sp.]
MIKNLLSSLYYEKGVITQEEFVEGMDAIESLEADNENLVDQIERLESDISGLEFEVSSLEETQCTCGCC